MGFFSKLFGTDDDGAGSRKVEAGKICPKCGEPVEMDNMAFDSGGGHPIHRVCPEPPPEPSEG